MIVKHLNALSDWLRLEEDENSSCESITGAETREILKYVDRNPQRTYRQCVPFELTSDTRYRTSME